MNDEVQHIELIEQYINGELNAEDNLYVEKLLAESAQWRDVYEGLQFAEQEGIDVAKRQTMLEERLFSTTPSHQQSARVIPIGMRKWLSIAAAIAGFMVLSYAALKIINSGITNQAGEQAVYHAEPSLYPEDEIQIIPPNKKVQIKQQEFDPRNIEELADQAQYITFGEDMQDAASNVGQALKDGQPQFSSPQPKPVARAESVEPDYPELLARYGYRQVGQPTLTNSARGATAPKLPSNHYERFTRNAMSSEQMKEFEAEFGKNFIARFPYSGIVKVKFVVNKLGKAEQFEVIESPIGNATKAVKRLFFEKAEWNIPLNGNSEAVQQEALGTVSFGNSIKIDIELE